MNFEERKEIVEKNKILEIKTGSNLYGLETPESDVDYGGVFVEPIEFVLPTTRQILSPFYRHESLNEIDLSIKDKKDNGRNSKDAIDRKFYSLKKFVKLAAENNPNIIEMLFVNPENIIYCNKWGKLLLDNRNLFLHEGLVERFIGYAISQEKKMYVKSNNYEAFKKFITFIEYQIETKNCFHNDKLVSLRLQLDSEKIGKFGQKQHEDKRFEDIYFIGDLSMGANIQIKTALDNIKNRFSKASGYRKQLVFERGYDYKFGSHVIRLLVEGIEMLKTGDLKFPLKQKDIIMRCKTGNMPIEELQEHISKLKKEFREIQNSGNHVLPKKPNYNKLEELLYEIQEEYYEL